MRRPALGQNEAHLWYVDLKAVREQPWFIEYCRRMLSPDESERAENIRSSSHKTTFIAAKALTRTVLAHYLSEPPHALSFARNEYGKPRLAAGRGYASHLCFNLSHTEDAAVLLVKDHDEVGVDIECLDRDFKGGVLDIASRSFAAEEAESVRLAENPHHRFLEFWTLKEAYVKAAGFGLSMPLSGFSFDFSASGEIGFSISGGSNRSGDRYSFFQSRDVPRHVLSICMENGMSETVSVTLVETVPGMWMRNRAIRLSRASGYFRQSVN